MCLGACYFTPLQALDDHLDAGDMAAQEQLPRLVGGSE